MMRKKNHGIARKRSLIDAISMLYCFFVVVTMHCTLVLNSLILFETSTIIHFPTSEGVNGPVLTFLFRAILNHSASVLPQIQHAFEQPKPAPRHLTRILDAFISVYWGSQDKCHWYLDVILQFSRSSINRTSHFNDLTGKHYYSPLWEKNINGNQRQRIRNLLFYDEIWYPASDQ